MTAHVTSELIEGLNRTGGEREQTMQGRRRKEIKTMEPDTKGM